MKNSAALALSTLFTASTPSNASPDSNSAETSDNHDDCPSPPFNPLTSSTSKDLFKAKQAKNATDESNSEDSSHSLKRPLDSILEESEGECNKKQAIGEDPAESPPKKEDHELDKTSDHPKMPQPNDGAPKHHYPYPHPHPYPHYPHHSHNPHNPHQCCNYCHHPPQHHPHHPPHSYSYPYPPYPHPPYSYPYHHQPGSIPPPMHPNSYYPPNYHGIPPNVHHEPPQAHASLTHDKSTIKSDPQCRNGENENAPSGSVVSSSSSNNDSSTTTKHGQRDNLRSPQNPMMVTPSPHHYPGPHYYHHPPPPHGYTLPYSVATSANSSPSSAPHIIPPPGTPVGLPYISSPGMTSAKKAKTYSRKDKSLGLLCANFMAKYGIDENSNEMPPALRRSLDNGISIDDAASSLCVERRRIYDIINILESIHIVTRKCKNTYYFNGTSQLPRMFARMQVEAVRMWPEDAKRHNIRVSETNEDASNLYSLAPPGQTKEKSLGKLSQEFLQLFLVGFKHITLGDATEKILGAARQGEDAEKIQAWIKTKGRRLYDIANVMASINIIKITTGEGRKKCNTRSFEWNYKIKPHEFQSITFNDKKPDTTSSDGNVLDEEEKKEETKMILI